MIYKNNNCPVFFACKDGTFSTNNKRGACRGHGGLKYKKEDLLESQIENYFYKEYHIADLLRSTKFDPESYRRFGDENFVKEKFMFLKKGGSLIDQDAQELTELIGVKVTPQDIVDAINLSSTPRSYMHYLKEETKDIMEREKKQSGVFGDNAFYFYGKGVFSKDKKFDFEAKTEEKESKPKKPEPRPIGFKQNIAPKPEKSANVIMFPKPEEKPTQAKLEDKYSLSNKKIKPVNITILWSEGVYSDLTPAKFLTYEEANEFLRNNISRRYVDGKEKVGYAKTKFEILWDSGETYEGRVDIDMEYNPFTTNNVIGCHIVDFWNYYLQQPRNIDDKEEIEKFLQTHDLGKCDKFPSVLDKYAQTTKQGDVIMFPKPEEKPTQSTLKILSSDIEKYYVLSDFVHTKTGKKLVLAKPKKTYNKDLFRFINSEAKKIGGYYSTFAKGFLFDDLNKDVEAFLRTNPESTTTKTIFSRSKKTSQKKSAKFYPPYLKNYTDKEKEELIEQGEKVERLIINESPKEQISYLNNALFFESFLVYRSKVNEIQRKEEDKKSMYKCRIGDYQSRIFDFNNSVLKFVISKMLPFVVPDFVIRKTISFSGYSSCNVNLTLPRKYEQDQVTQDKIQRDVMTLVNKFSRDCSDPMVDYFDRNYYFNVYFQFQSESDKKEKNKMGGEYGYYFESKAKPQGYYLKQKQYNRTYTKGATYYPRTFKSLESAIKFFDKNKFNKENIKLKRGYGGNFYLYKTELSKDDFEIKKGQDDYIGYINQIRK